MSNIYQENLKSIEENFGLICAKRGNREQQLQRIQVTLEKIFRKKFKIDVCSNNSHDFFGMSVYPAQSTMDALLEQILNNKSKLDTILDVWGECDEWFIEIDTILLEDRNLNVNPTEMTAILLHEIGHTIYTNSVPQRLNKVIRFQLTKVNIKTREMIRNPKIRNILMPTVIEACSTKYYRYIGTKEELAADRFVIKMGYGEALNSFLDKILRTYGNTLMSTTEFEGEAEVTSVLNWSIDAIDELKYRKTKLRNALNMQILATPSKYAKNCMNQIKDLFFGSGAQNDGRSVNNRMASFHRKVREDNGLALYESVVESAELAAQEAFLFKGPIRKLKKVDSMEIDYITIQLDKIKTHDDQVYLLDLIYYHNGLVEQGLEYIEKGYVGKVPNTKRELEEYRSQLAKLRERVLAVKISKRNPLDISIKVEYPKGFEG